MNQKVSMDAPDKKSMTLKVPKKNVTMGEIDSPDKIEVRDDSSIGDKDVSDNNLLAIPG